MNEENWIVLELGTCNIKAGKAAGANSPSIVAIL